MGGEPRSGVSMAAEVIVIGAGLAGLSAAVALSSAGLEPVVLERKPYVGGRAYSYPHPALDEVIDSQHVLLGCCTNLVDLCELSGAATHLRWYDEIPFLEPGGRRSDLRAGTSPRASLGFLRAPMLSLTDKLAIARGLLEFRHGYPMDDREAFSTWLQRTGQTQCAIKHFWEPVVISTLNDTFERCSTRYAAQVFYEAFLKSAYGGKIAVPTEPLSVFYQRLATLAEKQGSTIQLRASVDRLVREADGWRCELSDGSSIEGRKLMLALPFEQTKRLLDTLPDAASLPSFERFTHAPITTVHLWFDREITEIDQCALLDTRIQWMFNKSRIRRDEPQWRTPAGQYLELVISASFAELKETREQILDFAVRELALFFPKVREAKVLKSGILKEARATFSVTPGLDAFRPAAGLWRDGLYLAGDWTASGWPSTMEGAVRSGRLAAEAIAGRRFLSPDLPAKGLLALLP